MQAGQDFFNLYNHDFVRVGVGIPRVRVADPAFNSAHTIELMEQAAAQRAVLVLFPELGLSAYSCDDLFHQRALLDGVQEGLRGVVEASERLPLIAVGQCSHAIRRNEYTEIPNIKFPRRDQYAGIGG